MIDERTSVLIQHASPSYQPTDVTFQNPMANLNLIHSLLNHMLELVEARSGIEYPSRERSEIFSVFGVDIESKENGTAPTTLFFYNFLQFQINSSIYSICLNSFFLSSLVISFPLPILLVSPFDLFSVFPLSIPSLSFRRLHWTEDGIQVWR